MKTLRLLMMGMVVVGVATGMSGCILEKRVTTSYTLRICEDVPANWDADYYSWRLHQPLDLAQGTLKAKLSFNTPKGQGQPPTGYTWTLWHMDDLGMVLGSQVIPGTVKVRKYKGKSKLNVSLAGYNFLPGHELRVSGSFNSFVPRDTTIRANLKIDY